MTAAAIIPANEAHPAVERRSGRAADRTLLALLLLWGLAPAIAVAWHALSRNQRLTGADGIIGADQLQYLAWARDAGTHGLASNLFELAPTGHVYVQPMFELSGALWRLGLPLQASYWLWKPIAALVLFAGAAALARRAFASSVRPRLAALTLSLFMLAPLASLLAWVHAFSPRFRADALMLGAEMFPAGQLWGYLPTAIAIGLLPIALLSVERTLRADSPARPLAVACAAALIMSWLHPWQGVTLILILVGLALWSRGRSAGRIAPAVVAAGLPLVYYLVLSHTDSAWRLAAHNEAVLRPSLVALMAILAPVVGLAIVGIRRPGDDVFERALLLWVPAGLVSYAVLTAFPSHALDSLSLPLAVLMVRGWRRLRLSPALAVGAALAGVAAVTIPGLAYDARTFSDVAAGPAQEYYVNASDARALDWIRTRAPSGGVLAAPLFAIAVPSQTGRAVWVGHEFWSRDYAARALEADELFSGVLSPARARGLVSESGARLVLADCAHPVALQAALGPVVLDSHRFGCASVYVVRTP